MATNIKHFHRAGHSGFTLVELLLVLGIFAIIAATASFSFSKLNGSQLVDKTTLSIISILESERSLAISSKDASDFGVRISKTKITSFEGSYGTSNSDYILSNLVGISTSTGIGTDIIFNNLYGDTSASGTISVYLLADPTHTSSTIRVFSTGAVERD